MPLVRTSARALFLAMLPVAAVQIVLLLLSARFWFDNAALGLVGPDGMIALFALQLSIFAGLLFAGHLILRHFAAYSRSAYAGIGATAALVAYVTAARYGILSSTPVPGTWISAAILPTLAGTMSGFLYGQYAGIESVAGPIVASNPAAEPQSEGISGRTPDPVRGRFDGPVRVRSSLGATALVTFLPAFLVGVLSFWSLQFGLLGMLEVQPALLFGMAAQAFVVSLFTTALPAVLLTVVIHHTARALGYMRGVQYAIIGAGYAALFALIAGPFTTIISIKFLFVPTVIAGTLMGALYRRFAGLEPMPLPEAVIVTDVEHLVPADDPSRRGHSILLNG